MGVSNPGYGVYTIYGLKRCTNPLRIRQIIKSEFADLVAIDVPVGITQPYMIHK